MSRSRRSTLSRRQLLNRAMAAGALGIGGASLPRILPRARAGDDGPRFLVVIGCFGGASMIDCFNPVDRSEALTVDGRGTVISHDTTQIGGVRCPNRSVPVDFLKRHGQQCAVIGYQGSSVNHFEAQRRSVNGRGTLDGRTLTEAVAAAHGASMPLPNISMGRGGYSESGSDPALDPRYLAEIVTNPVTFALSTSGHAGILPTGDLAVQDPELRAAMVARARALRDGSLEGLSPWGQTFPSSRIRQELLSRRALEDPSMEAADLISKLLYVPDLGELFPLSEYGLGSSEDAALISEHLDDAFPVTTSGVANDRFEGQAALAYLMIKYQVSAAITLTDPGTDGFLAFDQSHAGHADAQADHWDRALDVASRLIQLLESAEYHDASGATGTSYWDRTAILFATEFGRDKWDTGDGFGTGHNMNNGLLLVSPMLQGDQVLGQVDPNNGYISGYDLETGEPTPFDDLVPGEEPTYDDERLPPGEEAVYGSVLDLLGVEYDDQETIPALKKS